ncbi:MAG TPA: hypothetical protein GXZ93_00815 [Actinobacteria bacterium]|nr:hypothetical protein [Actinomycetota bacterium]
MKILVLITNNKEITDNISLLKSDNLEIIPFKRNNHLIYYLEEYIPDFIILDYEEKITDLEYFLERNPDIKIFTTSNTEFFKEHENTVRIKKISGIDSVKEVIKIINSLENSSPESKEPIISENLRIINQQVLSYLSIKGGTGNTVSALNTAVIASEEFNLKTAFIDMGFSEAFSDISSYLKITGTPNLCYYFQNYKDGNSALENTMSFRSKKGLDIFISPLSSKFINKLDSVIFSSFIYLLRSKYNFIIFDYPANLFSVNSFFNSVADFTTFFMTSSLPSRLCANKVRAVIRTIGEHKKLFSIINNTCSISDAIEKKEYEKISDSTVLSEIPFLDAKVQKKLKINNLDTEIIDIRRYLRNIFNDYLIR